MYLPASNDRQFSDAGLGHRLLLRLMFAVLCCHVPPLLALDYQTPAIDPDALATLGKLDQHTLVIDLRLPVEYAVAHVPGAVNIDPAAIEQHLNDIRAADRTVLYCIIGKRTREAEQRLSTHDVANIYHLEGGFGAWIRSGLPVEKGIADTGAAARLH